MNSTANPSRRIVLKDLFLDGNVIFTTTEQLTQERSQFGDKVKEIVRINSDNWAIVLAVN